MSGSKSLKIASRSVVDRIAEIEHRYCKVSSLLTGWRGRGLCCQSLEATRFVELQSEEPAGWKKWCKDDTNEHMSLGWHDGIGELRKTAQNLDRSQINTYQQLLWNLGLQATQAALAVFYESTDDQDRRHGAVAVF